MSTRTIGGRTLRWNEEIARAAYSKGHWRKETLADSLAQAACNTPERILLTDPVRRLDCRTLHRETAGLAQALLRRVPAGSVVSFMLPNWHEAALIYLATCMAGMIAHPILPSLRDHELKFMLDDADSRVIFIPGFLRNHDYPAMLARVSRELRRPPEVIVVRGESDGDLAFADLLHTPAADKLPELDPDSVNLVLYTSGTTSTPKGVLHSHNSIHAAVRQIGDAWRVSPGDCFLVASPISHVGGSLYAFECPLLLGARAVLMDRWDPGLAAELAERERCTHVAGATPFLAQLLTAAQARQTRLPSLKFFICGGASVPPSLIRRASAQFSRAVVTRVYGSTEVPASTVGSPDPGDLDHAADTDGRPGIASIKLVGVAGVPVAGAEIWVRGPQMLVGYVHAEDQVRLFDEEGYFRTGDLGRWHDGHYLVVSGRLKDIIIRNGENISPKEIEDILIEYPGIAEVAVVGLPDARTGERACAVIVSSGIPTPGVNDIREFLGAHGVATFKIPEQVAVWERLPKNDAGKVLKHRVRAQLLEQTKGPVIA